MKCDICEKIYYTVNYTEHTNDELHEAENFCRSLINKKTIQITISLINYDVGKRDKKRKKYCSTNIFPFFQEGYDVNVLSSSLYMDYASVLAEPIPREGPVFLMDIKSIVKQICNEYIEN